MHGRVPVWPAFAALPVASLEVFWPALQVRLALEVMFEGVCGTAASGGVQSNGLPAGKGQVLRVGDAVTVTYK